MDWYLCSAFLHNLSTKSALYVSFIQARYSKPKCFLAQIHTETHTLPHTRMHKYFAQDCLNINIQTTDLLINVQPPLP